jgi:ribose-phosphate pyrophosphokinase
MKIFAASEYYQRFVSPLCESSTDITPGKAEIKRFPNGEMHAVVHEDVMEEECLAIGSVAPPDEQLLALLTLANTLKRNGAKSVRVFLPYMGYARQDKFKTGESGGIALIGSLLRAAGVDSVITIDAHSKLDQKLIGLPFTSLSPVTVFIPAIHDLRWSDATVVAPDEGAIARAQAVADALESSRPVAHLVKIHVDGIVHLNLTGEVSKCAVIVDDIIDSGRTLVSACNVLHGYGVQEIAVVVTHGLFTGGAWKRLFGLGVKMLLTSDSCPEAKLQKHKSVHVISLNPLLPAVLSGAAIKEKRYESAIT